RYWETCLEIRKAARAQAAPYVLPKRFHVSMSVTANRDSVPAGETIRVWMPVPRQSRWTADFDLLSASPAVKSLDRPDSSIRSAYFEQAGEQGHSARFSIEYAYTTRAVWFDLDPEKVRPVYWSDPDLTPFTREAAHVVFTPAMRALSRQIGMGETNSYRLA